MSGFSILILLINSEAFAKPVIAGLSKGEAGDVFVTINDLNQLKIMFLTFALTGLFSVGKMFWNWVRNKDSSIDARIDKIESAQEEILKAIQRLDIHLAQVRDHKVTEKDVRDIVRDEYEFIQRYRQQKD